jgi:hypothetical protein
VKKYLIAACVIALAVPALADGHMTGWLGPPPRSPSPILGGDPPPVLGGDPPPVPQ